MQDEETTSKLRGVYSFTDVPVEIVKNLEGTIEAFRINFNSLPMLDAQKQALDVFDDMKGILYPKFEDEFLNFKVKIRSATGIVNEYDFDTLYKSALECINEDERFLLSRIFQNCLYIFRHFTGILGYKEPISRLGHKKKLTLRLFSVVPNKDESWFSDFFKDYNDKLKICHLHDSYLNYKSYNLYEMANHDIDRISMKIGANRVGKSIETLHEIIRVTCFEQNLRIKDAISFLVKSDLIDKRTILDENEDWQSLFETREKEIFFFDEAFTTGADKRDAMTDLLKTWTHILSKYAKNNNLSYLLLPRIRYIDNRFTDKSNSCTVLSERGLGYDFAKKSNYPLIDDSYGFDRFKKNPQLLENDISAEHNLKRLPSFIHKIKWQDMKAEQNKILWMSLPTKYYNPLYEQYKYKKDERDKKEALKPNTSEKPAEKHTAQKHTAQIEIPLSPVVSDMMMDEQKIKLLWRMK